MHFADTLITAIKHKQSTVCVGLDPRLEKIPDFLKKPFIKKFDKTTEAAAHIILEFNKGIIAAVHDLVPAVKPQSAFYEQYGHHGVWALEETVRYAREKGLLVILDAKRNDISSTAEAYSSATIGKDELFGTTTPVLNADAVTVTPYLGSDSIAPFTEDCKKYGKGIFILVKTSNKSSSEIQDIQVGADCQPLHEHIAHLVNDWGQSLIGSSGYSSIGAVVGAPYPEAARKLRTLMPKTIFLVPGYGAQGATAEDIKHCFNDNGLGAVINSSRGIIYAFEKSGAPEGYAEAARQAVVSMNEAITKAMQT